MSQPQIIASSHQAMRNEGQRDSSAGLAGGNSTSTSSGSGGSSNVVGVHYKVGKKIGEGSFGVIFEGAFINLVTPAHWIRTLGKTSAMTAGRTVLADVVRCLCACCSSCFVSASPTGTNLLNNQTVAIKFVGGFLKPWSIPLTNPMSFTLY